MKNRFQINDKVICEKLFDLKWFENNNKLKTKIGIITYFYFDQKIEEFRYNIRDKFGFTIIGICEKDILIDREYIIDDFIE
jgi:hypothetical protein